MMDLRGLLVSLLLWSSGLQKEELNMFEVIDGIRLVEGSSRCSGVVQVKRERIWREVDDDDWNLKLAGIVCRYLDCGSVVQTSSRKRLSSPKWTISRSCLGSESGLKKCLTKRSPHPTSLKIICSESVRLVNGTSLCSGRLEVKPNQSNQWWSSVCDADFDLQDAEVVCRELGCGAPSVLQGALYGDVEASMWTKEFQCGGHESALLDCRISGSERNTCSPGKAVGLTCSEPHDVRLVGGSNRCAGELEMKQRGEWKRIRVDYEMSDWNLKTIDEVCRRLDCGSAVSKGRRKGDTKLMWRISSSCVQESTIRECIHTKPHTHFFNWEIKCSESVRLVNGKNLCSGRLEVKSDQSNQWWSSVCEDDFDQQDAEVVCRELGCGAPSVLQGALYGDVEASMWTKEFQCGGHESALLDCRSSGSERNTCSPGKAVGLTCSEPAEVRLVGGSSRCDGRLEMKHNGDWRPVVEDYYEWDWMSAAVVCRELDCGSVHSTRRRDDSYYPHTWILVRSFCDMSASKIQECVSIRPGSSKKSVNVNCSESVRLVNGTSLCSGRLEVKSNQSWSSVCEDDFDLQEAEVVCRELGCGAPSVLQGALYGSVRNSCLRGKAVGLTCSEPVRLSGGSGRCDGTPEMEQHGEWRPVTGWSSEWEQKVADAVCHRLDCGSAVSATTRSGSLVRSVWWIHHSCVESFLMLRECLQLPSDTGGSRGLEVICSDFLAQPNISFVTHIDGVSEANQQGLQVLMGSNFTLSCSTLPQHPGGSFQLLQTTSATSQDYTLPAVNHSAHFLFSAADPAHRGEFRCVYHLHVFSRNFSSESRTLYLAISAPVTHLIIRLVVLLLVIGVSNAALFCYCKASRGQKPRGEDIMELGSLGEEPGAQGTQ